MLPGAQYHIVKDKPIPSNDLSNGLELETLLGQAIEVSRCARGKHTAQDLRTRVGDAFWQCNLAPTEHAF